MKYYLDAFKKYAKISGRATRKELWMFLLFNMLASSAVVLVEVILGLSLEDGSNGPLSSLYTLAVLCPTFCLYVRRLHDVNKSGWWYALIFVPFANLYLLYLLGFKKGTAGINNFGSPAGESIAAAAYSIPVDNSFSSYEMCPTPEPAEKMPALEKPELPQIRKKCPYCGTELKVAAKFCSECGAPQE